MITEKQRRRALARAKWERQQARRTAAQRRARMWSIIGGAAAAVVLVVFVGWGVVHLVTNDDDTPSQQLPTGFPTFQTPPITRSTTVTSPPTTGSKTGTTTTGSKTGTTTTGSTP